MALINASTLNQLKEQLESSDFLEIVELYIKDLPILIQQLEEHVLKMNLEESRRIAHTIKGSASNMGADDLHACAEQMEQYCKTGDFQAAKDDFAKIKRLTQNTVQEIQNYI